MNRELAACDKVRVLDGGGMEDDAVKRRKEAKMPEYISREAALDSICTACEVVPIDEKETCPYKFTGCEYGRVWAIPAADVVEVVRCKDCKHRFNHSICACRGDNWFCGYGERRAK